MLIFSLYIDSQWYCTAMFWFVKLVVSLLPLFVFYTAYTFGKEAAKTNKTLSDEKQDSQTLFVHQFIIAKDYSERKGIFSCLIGDENCLIGDKNIVEATVELLSGQENSLFKIQLFHFLVEMRKAEDMSQRDHVAILFSVIRKQSKYTKYLNPLVLDHLSEYSFTELDVETSLIEASLIDVNTPLKFKLFLLKGSLEEGVCNKSVASTTLNVVRNNDLDVRIRAEMLIFFSEKCNKHDDFKKTMTTLAVEPKLEWFLKEKVLLLYDPEYNRICSDKVLDHLFSFFSEDIDWHVRNTVIWMLSNVQGNVQEICDNKIISFFSNFVQKSSEGMSIKLLDFRQTMIQSILWSLVRLGLRNENKNVVFELKKIAMRYDVNEYFRIRAVEALQDLSIFLDSAAQALYEIVRDNKRIPQSEFVTYEQKERDFQDKKVRKGAFIALVELVTKNRSDFLSFIHKHKEELHSDQLYRRKAFADLLLPERLDSYAHPALLQLYDDKKVDQDYRDYVRDQTQVLHQP